MKKTTLFPALLLCLVMLLGVLSLPAHAENEPAAEGVCGESVTWTLRTDGLLILEGSGANYDYNDSYDYNIPWYSKASATAA